MSRLKKSKGSKSRKTRVPLRANRSRPARDRGWTKRFRESAADGVEDADPVARESVVAKGEHSRMRTVVEPAQGQPAGNLLLGRVVALSGPVAEVDDGTRLWPCSVRRLLRTRRIEERHPLAVGDYVRFSVFQQEGRERSAVIEQVLPRRSSLMRTYDERVQTIAANVDQAVIVASLEEPPPKPHLIDRYIVSAHAGQMTPVVCLNKCDLVPAIPGQDPVRQLRELYEPLGYPCVVCSATAAHGLDQLRKVLTGKTSVFVGQSGVGKSSLLNALQPDLSLPTGEVSTRTFKGRHVTTTTRLLKLSFGGWVVDTPGVRSFALARVPREELEKHFVEIAPLVAECKFPDCAHVHEGGCAVRAAAESGRIHPSRYDSYVRLFCEE